MSFVSGALRCRGALRLALVELVAWLRVTELGYVLSPDGLSVWLIHQWSKKDNVYSQDPWGLIFYFTWTGLCRSCGS